MKPVLLPVPRRVEWLSGQFNAPSNLTLMLGAWVQELLPVARRFQGALPVTVSISASAVDLKGPCAEVVQEAAVAHDQGYRLTVAPERITVAARTPAGAAAGLATLKQLLAGGRAVPCVQIEDHPDFGRRGVMLDISRGKVPTMETLYRFVDMLADLKINEFQLYTEHTFAYRDHPEVWQAFSPMTHEQILLLDRYCQERFIDLVPNQNSFGHMYEWLRHDRYKHMAEVTDGWTAWGIWHEGPFSFNPQEPSVLPLLSDLYDELLPHFTSPYFNVGCDETFDLGQGRSQELVEEVGEHRVYLDFLLKIYEQVKARGKTMQFWGDIILKAPEFIAELPKDIVALEWGYEANHPFEERCGHFARAGVPFYVCPGTSTWNTLAGRTDNALGNLRSAAENGIKFGAIGFLNTIWGDRGHQDYQPVSYLPVAYGAAVSWAAETNRDATPVTAYLNQTVFADRAGTIGQLLYDLGNIYRTVGKEPSNASALGQIMHAPLDQFRPMKDVTAEGLDRAAAAIRAVAARIDKLELDAEDGALVIRELQNCVRMLLHACGLGKLKLLLQAGETPVADEVRVLALDLDEIMAEHRHLWLARNRIGGLEEMSLRPLRKIRAGYDRLLGK